MRAHGLLILVVGALASPLHAELGDRESFRLLDLGGVFSQRAAELERQQDPRLEEVLAAYRAEFGALPAASSILPSPYPIYPFAGVHDEDVHPFDYVDLDPSPSVQDFDCGSHSYDGHDAVDFWLPSFGEQDAGVPVFTPLPGRVAHAQDGYPDHQRECSPNTENYVVIDHGGGHTTAYGHLANGSVRVALGQMVKAGDEVGLIASSGCSYWPHLHFRTHLNNLVVEPHTGPCNPGGSGWRNQRQNRSQTRIWDFGFSHRGPGQLAPGESPPGSLPRLGRIGKRDRRLHLWAYLLDLRAAAPMRVRAFGPDGLVGYDSGTFYTENPELARLAIGWHTIDTAPFRGNWGTWTFEVSIDGEVMVEAPLDIQKKRKRKLNRPPATARKVLFEPRQPDAAGPIVCIAEVDHLLDDPDYDVVRYWFEWAVNGEIVRERTWAARSDVLPAETASPGDTLACTVVPVDDRAAGEAAAAEVTVR